MMQLREIIFEVEAAADQEAAGISILETTHFEPELARSVPAALAAAKRRAEALAMAAKLLRHPLAQQLPGLSAGRARP